MVTQRSRAKLGYVAIGVVSAVLCALNHAPMLAVAQGIAAIALCRVRFGQSLEPPEVDALIASLRDARMAEKTRPTMMRAMVTANVIAVPMRTSRIGRWRRTAIAFRDELTAILWLQLTTALRHQPRPDLTSALTPKIRIT